MLFVFLPAAHANAVDLQIEVNPEKINKGDTFTVTVAFKSNGEAIDALQASLKYDADKMEYITGGGNAAELSNGSGGISDNGSETENTMLYNLRFRALKTGKANFAVTGSEVIGFVSGTKLGSPSLNKTIEILKTQNPEQTDEINDPLEITLEGKRFYIIRDLANLDLPSGFETEETSYNGAKIEAAFEPVSGLTLFYLMDESSDGSFYIFDSPTNSIYPYINVTVDTAYQVLTLDTVPKGYKLSTAKIGGQTVPACVPEKEGSYLYLLYALNSSGAKGFYFYDTADGTMQRAYLKTVSVPQAASSQTPEPSAAEKDVKSEISDNGEIPGSLYILTVLCVLLAALMIWLIFSVRNKKAKN